MLRPPHVPLQTLLGVVGEKFVSLRSLKLERIRKINDEDLVNLCKLSSLTCLDFSMAGHGCVRDITNIGMNPLGILRELKDLKLIGCEKKKTTDVGINQLRPRTSLTTLCLTFCNQITDEGLKCIEHIGIERNLDLMYCRKTTSAALRDLSSFTPLTRLRFYRGDGRC